MPGERARGREGARGREAPLRGLDHPRTLDAREKWSLQAVLKAVFFDPIIGHYSVGELDRQSLNSLLLNIKREQEKHANLSVFLGNVAVFPYLGAVGIIQFRHRVAVELRTQSVSLRPSCKRDTSLSLQTICTESESDSTVTRQPLRSNPSVQTAIALIIVESSILLF